MKIISHRGWWRNSDEKNSRVAFERALDRGFGIETDFRDCANDVVISHDPPVGGEMAASEFLELCELKCAMAPLALNIKADGLAPALSRRLRERNLQSFFAFDMAVPDALAYLREGIPTYTRTSEFETEPAFFSLATGVWIDAFYNDNYSRMQVRRFLDQGKAVCIVSPELHKRNPHPFWEDLATWDETASDALSICTDLPLEALNRFGGNAN